MSSNFLKKHKTNTCLYCNIKTKKNIKKIENTIDSIIVTLYNIDKLKRVSEQIKKRTAGTVRKNLINYHYHVTKERSAFIIQDKCKKDK